jgi:ribonuclease BN (tRNA processing enzyme)
MTSNHITPDHIAPFATAVAWTSDAHRQANAEEASLCEFWQTWCEREGLDCRSADEMDEQDMTPEQRKVVAAFTVLWDAWVSGVPH